MPLFLCEKPSPPRDIARLLGATQKAKGCLRTDCTYLPKDQIARRYLAQFTIAGWRIGHAVSSPCGIAAGIDP